tara:strand:- start:192 stop:1202 length:1011 start_codon:yes stop_codon:yes gene_type:complete
MIVSQRATQVTGAAAVGYYVCDRWRLNSALAGTWTLSQSTDTPNGFSNSLKFDCTTANGSLSSGSNLEIVQFFEGQDLQDILKGTPDAKEITVSFYVKTNKTGTYIVGLLDHDNSFRHCSKSYTVSDTNWNRYTVTFPADTTGILDNDNQKSLEVGFWLAAGSDYSSGSLQTSWGSLSNASRASGQVNLADSTSNEWYLTGVQLEVSDHATDFEYRSFAQELALCQRYYYVVADGRDDGITNQMGLGYAYSATQIETTIFYPVMRTAPSLVQGTGTNYFLAVNTNAMDQFNSYIIYAPSPRVALLYQNNGVSGLTTGQAYRLEFDSNAYIHLNAEL